MDNKKRPRGLKKAISKNKENANKRLKEDGDAKTAAADVPVIKKDTRTVAIDADDEDEISIIKGLLDAANEKEEAGDAEAALDLYRGCVHECDKILRIQCGDAGNAEGGATADKSNGEADTGPLPPDFYHVFGKALFQLGAQLTAGSSESAETSDELYKDYLEAAISRFERGVERAVEDNIPVSAPLLASLGATYLALAVELLNKAPIDEENEEIEQIQSLEAKAREQYKFDCSGIELEERNALRLEAASTARHYADSRSDQESLQSWSKIATDLYNDVLKDTPDSIDAHIGLASCYLTSASGLLQSLEEGGESESGSEEAAGYLRQGLGSLDKAISLMSETDGTNTQIEVLRGELLINLGNVLEATAGGDGDKYYTQAIQCFRKVIEVDSEALPAEFKEFVDDWERDMNASDAAEAVGDQERH
ncbi:nuclear pore complex subunit Nro1-domain-containing protein [Phlyctochytrium arcticum]|nr:nuclear pore complex subunit Nro1-domain-containing protein [Phlyctochytrium arcticum]